MTQRLPIAIIIPHSSLDTPPELTDRTVLTPEQIFNEADSYTDRIFDYRDRVLHWHQFPYARCFIDVNRPNEPHPLVGEGDGIVKRKTSYGAEVFASGKEPDAELEQHLIDTYWQTWHDNMAEIVTDERVKLAIDCHSMAAIGPSHYIMTEARQIRPRITVINRGDRLGNPRSDEIQITASPELTRNVGKAFAEALADLRALAPNIPASINEPFWTGYQISRHGGTKQHWLMVELSRAMYIGEQSGDSPIVPPNDTRIALLRERIWTAIETVVKTSGLLDSQ